jgi:hypothetical protein
LSTLRLPTLCYPGCMDRRPASLQQQQRLVHLQRTRGPGPGAKQHAARYKAVGATQTEVTGVLQQPKHLTGMYNVPVRLNHVAPCVLLYSACSAAMEGTSNPVRQTKAPGYENSRGGHSRHAAPEGLYRPAGHGVPWLSTDPRSQVKPGEAVHGLLQLSRPITSPYVPAGHNTQGAAHAGWLW